MGFSDPPSWYPAEQRLTWQMPGSTVCIWPFEEMYRDEVRATGGNRQYDYDKRREYAEDYLGCSTNLSIEALKIIDSIA